MVDREILDWYRHVTGERAARLAWTPLLRALRVDMRGSNSPALEILTAELRHRLDHPITPLRVIDIAVWMGGRA